MLSERLIDSKLTDAQNANKLFEYFKPQQSCTATLRRFCFSITLNGELTIISHNALVTLVTLRLVSGLTTSDTQA